VTTTYAQVGADHGIDRAAAAQVSPQTEAMLGSPGIERAMLVPARYADAVEAIAQHLRRDGPAILERIPALQERYAAIVRELRQRVGAEGGNLDALLREAHRAMAREILRANNVSPELDGQGELLVAIPDPVSRMAMIGNLIRNLGSTSGVGAEPLDWFAAVAGKQANLVHAANALHGVLDADIPQELIRTGRIPTNLTERQLRGWVERAYYPSYSPSFGRATESTVGRAATRDAALITRPIESAAATQR
jgi:hypothetical protein